MKQMTITIIRQSLIIFLPRDDPSLTEEEAMAIEKTAEQEDEEKDPSPGGFKDPEDCSLDHAEKSKNWKIKFWNAFFIVFLCVDSEKKLIQNNFACLHG